MGLNSRFRAKFVPKCHKVEKNGFSHIVHKFPYFCALPKIFTNNQKILIKGQIVLQTQLSTYPKIMGRRGGNRQKWFQVLKVTSTFPPQSNKSGENCLTSNHVHMKQLEPSRKNPDHGFWAVSQLVVFLREAHLTDQNLNTWSSHFTL